MDYQYWVDFAIMCLKYSIHMYSEDKDWFSGDIQNLQNQGSCVLGSADLNDDTTKIYWIHLCAM